MRTLRIKTQLPLNLLLIEEIRLVEQSDPLDTCAAHKHRAPGDPVCTGTCSNSIVRSHCCAPKNRVNKPRQPSVLAATKPKYSWLVVKRYPGSDKRLVRMLFGGRDHCAQCIRSHNRIVVQDPHVVCALLDRDTETHIYAAREP